MALTGRYKFEPTRFGYLRVLVEVHSLRGHRGFAWRRAKKRDLKALEPAVADGWRFIEERNGQLYPDGKRIR